MQQSLDNACLGSLFIVSAPSGAGKSSLMTALIKQDPTLALSISHTTRQPRPGDVHGREYFFTSVEDFEALIAQEEFLEHARVHDNYYGTSKTAVLEQLKAGQDTLLEIDWQGARQIRQQFQHAISIFILPPSIEALKERLIKRGQDSLSVITARLNAANDEIMHAGEFDYVIINDDFNTALSNLTAIITAARCRSEQQSIKKSELFKQFNITMPTGTV